MGHVFVPVALVLWVAVAVVRALATPAPASASVPAREVKVQQAHSPQADSASVSEAQRVKAHGEG